MISLLGRALAVTHTDKDSHTNVRVHASFSKNVSLDDNQDRPQLPRQDKRKLSGAAELA